MTILITDETQNINEINFRLAHCEVVSLADAVSVAGPLRYYVYAVMY